MALVMLDRVQETTNTTGTGTLTLAGATSGCQTFSNIGNGNTTYYTIYSSPDWEVGIGTYTSAGNTLSRDLVLASSLGGTTKINVAAGAFVFGTYPAGRAVYTDASTNLTLPANLTFDGTGARITGDFSNATLANRVAFQTSTVNGNTNIFALPNGTSNISQFVAFNSADPTNSSGIAISQVGTIESRIQAISTGTGSYLPMTFYTGGSERMRIDTSGNVGIGTNSPVQLLTVESTSNVRATIRNSTENTSYSSSLDFATGSGSLASTNVVGRVVGLITQADPSTLQSALTFHTNSGDNLTEKMRIDSAGNVGIGTTPGFKLDVNGTIQGASGLSSNVAFAMGGANNAIRDTTNGASVMYFDVSTGGATNGSFIFRSSNAYTERMVINSSGEVGIGITPDGSSILQIKAGNATESPLELTAGTLMTTPDGGSIEYDGTAFYTTPVNNRRGISPSEYYYRLNTTVAGANVNTVQNTFGVGITLDANTIYEFEIFMLLYKSAGTTSHTLSVGFGGTAGINNITYATSGAQQAATPLVNQPLYTSMPTSTAQTLVKGASTTAIVATGFILKGTVSISTSGTFIPQYQCSAAPGGAYTTQIGSYIKIKPIGAAGATINVGGFA